jgi:hypothetical protein
MAVSLVAFQPISRFYCRWIIYHCQPLTCSPALLFCRSQRQAGFIRQSKSKVDYATSLMLNARAHLQQYFRWMAFWDSAILSFVLALPR